MSIYEFNHNDTFTIKPTLLTSIVYAWQQNMTPLKCFHLNSVTRLILITILVSIFSQSFDCKPANSVIIETSEQGNISQPIDQPITTNKPPRSNDTKGPVVKRAAHPPEDNFGSNKNEHKCFKMVEPVSPKNLLFYLKDYKIMMGPLVEKINPSDFKVTLHVKARPRSDYRKKMNLPTLELNTKNKKPPALNSSKVKSIKVEVPCSHSSSTTKSPLISTYGNSSDLGVIKPNEIEVTTVKSVTSSNSTFTTNPLNHKNLTTIRSPTAVSENATISGNDTVTISLTVVPTGFNATTMGTTTSSYATFTPNPLDQKNLTTTESPPTVSENATVSGSDTVTISLTATTMGTTTSSNGTFTTNLLDQKNLTTTESPPTVSENATVSGNDTVTISLAATTMGTTTSSNGTFTTNLLDQKNLTNTESPTTVSENATVSGNDTVTISLAATTMGTTTSSNGTFTTNLLDQKNLTNTESPTTVSENATVSGNDTVTISLTATTMGTTTSSNSTFTTNLLDQKNSTNTESSTTVSGNKNITATTIPASKTMDL